MSVLFISVQEKGRCRRQPMELTAGPQPGSKHVTQPRDNYPEGSEDKIHEVEGAGWRMRWIGDPPYVSARKVWVRAAIEAARP